MFKIKYKYTEMRYHFLNLYHLFLIPLNFKVVEKEINTLLMKN